MASHATGDGGLPPRDATTRGLKRIMTLGGAYATRNYTVKDLRDQKGKRVLVETLPFTPEEAAAAEEAGVDTMKVRFDPKRPELAASIATFTRCKRPFRRNELLDSETSLTMCDPRASQAPSMLSRRRTA